LPLSKLPVPNVASVLSLDGNRRASGSHASEAGAVAGGSSIGAAEGSTGLQTNALQELEVRPSISGVGLKSSPRAFGLPLASSDSLTSFEDFDPTTYFKPKGLHQHELAEGSGESSAGRGSGASAHGAAVLHTKAGTGIGGLHDLLSASRSDSRCSSRSSCSSISGRSSGSRRSMQAAEQAVGAGL